MSGEVIRRAGTDELRLAVAPVGGGWAQLQVYVNDVEMTAAGAGMGMDPHKLFLPTNRMVATSVPRTIPIARHVCGFYCCVGTDVTIERDGDVVHWDWSRDVPASRGFSFPATHYDDEVRRAAADTSWETPVRVAGRLVLTTVDRELLRGHGLRLADLSTHQRETFTATLELNQDYQIFIATPWTDPETVAREMRTVLSAPPQEWHATWHPVDCANDTRPTIAGPSWRRETL